jgi:hypothetical protein
MTLDLLVRARAATAGSMIAKRVVDWSTPFWRCMWAIFILLWYSGARKSDAMPTKNTPFSKRWRLRHFPQPGRRPSAKLAPADGRRAHTARGHARARAHGGVQD